MRLRACTALHALRVRAQGAGARPAAAATVTWRAPPRSPIVSSIYRKALQDLELGGHRIPKVAARSSPLRRTLHWWAWHGCSASVSLHRAPQTLIIVQHPINDQNTPQRQKHSTRSRATLRWHVCCAGVLVPEQERRCCAGRAQGRRILINMWHVLRSDERFAGKDGDDGPHSFCPERWMADDAQRAGAWHAPGHLPRPPPCAACPAAPTQGRGSETRGSTRGGAGAAVKALHARHTINSVYLCQSAACRACRHWCELFTQYPRRGWVLMHRWRRC